MKIASFNINNVNRRLTNLLNWLREAERDIACLQEIKAADGEFPVEAIPQAGYHASWRGERRWNDAAILARWRPCSLGASIGRYMAALETADRRKGMRASQVVSTEGQERGAARAMAAIKNLAPVLRAASDEQISLTDPDARSMATSGRGRGIVGYYVQIAADAELHLAVAHEVTNVGHDREQLSSMAGQAKAAMGVEALDALADRGYFKGAEVLACERIGVTSYVPKPLTCGAKAEAQFGKQEFIYLPENDTYGCVLVEKR